MEPLAGDILVVGLGASGEAVAAYCSAAPDASDGPVSVTVCDSADDARVRERAERVRALGVRVELGVEQVPGRYDLAILSPGVPPHAPLFRAAIAASAETISEIEFAFRRSSAPWIAVTGTNGKTTVTSLIGHLLVSGGVSARTVGNIGTPAIEVAEEVGPTGALVAEVSSFQLALTRTFHPRVSVLLNVTPDHLDWHGDMETYTADKARIFASQNRDDVAVIDADDPGSAAHIEPTRERGVRVIPVSRTMRTEGGAWLDTDGTLAVGTPSGVVGLVSRDELRIQGDHNVSNALAAAAAALAFGVDPSAVRSGLKSFEPIEHRLEPVGIVAGIEYFNDSKATNPDAVVKALTAFEARPLVLLLGGRNKNNDFSGLARAIAQIDAVPVVFGEAAEDIAGDLVSAGVSYERASGLAEAVAMGTARASGHPGAAVLLSPACASFDEFTDYADRGRAFKSLVSAIAGEVS
jgi:UDP-N-acetylmuramoylalanine--D-glutamate ligase